ncbi:hypothetical protein FB45DRAFT_1002693 [Roridomyces roridus]|uniref:DUF6533 domain-containing protein n=1 Tax=Roridomyces roridus TaxID=1738132 RepID=A0AAD7C0E2_9AGAR|nr:hypothetical protein FB45DRAFT_1002693 [Roridomyces roridus]
MDPDQSSIESALTEFFWGRRFTDSWVYVPLVILLYDHLLTLDLEVRYIWRGPKRLSFFFFMILRYTPLLCTLTLMLLGYLEIPAQKCIGVGLTRVALLIFQCVLVNIVLGVRLYAIYNYSRIILGVLFCMAFTALFFAIRSMTGETGLSQSDKQGLEIIAQLAGCGFPLTKHKSVFSTPHVPMLTMDSLQSSVRFAEAWEAQGACDIIAFALIVLRAWRQPLRLRGSILNTIVKDGAFYFIVMALANLANILMYYYGNPTEIDVDFLQSFLVHSYVRPLVYPQRFPAETLHSLRICVTMMCRLMLNLHHVADVGNIHLSSSNANAVNSNYYSSESDGIGGAVGWAGRNDTEMNPMVRSVEESRAANRVCEPPLPTTSSRSASGLERIMPVSRVSGRTNLRFCTCRRTEDWVRRMCLNLATLTWKDRAFGRASKRWLRQTQTGPVLDVREVTKPLSLSRETTVVPEQRRCFGDAFLS